MEEYIGKKCPFCNSIFTENDDVVFCSICSMPHHLECWKENKGCTTFGCTGTIERVIQNSKKITENGFRTIENESIPNIPGINQTNKGNECSTTVLKEDKEAVLFPELKIICKGYSIIGNDGKSEDLSVRFNFIHYADKPINAILADIEGLDLWGKQTEIQNDVQFLDLHANSGEIFGENKSVGLTAVNTRKIKLTLKGVVFENGSVEMANPSSETLNSPVLLSSIITDSKLLDFYKQKTSSSANYQPTSQQNLKMCSCGAIFSSEKKFCRVCGVEFEKSVKLSDISILSEEYDAAVKEAKDKERKRKEEEEENQRRLAEAEKEFNYNNLCDKFEKAVSVEDYTELAEEFEKFGDYSDAREKASICDKNAHNITVNKKKKKKRSH